MKRKCSLPSSFNSSMLPIRAIFCWWIAAAAKTTNAFSLPPSYSAMKQTQSPLVLNRDSVMTSRSQQRSFPLLSSSSPSSLLKRQMSSSNNDNSPINFRRGDKLQVEIVRFGPLGASVEVIAHNSHREEDLIPEDAYPIAYGLVLQAEIRYYREARRGLDVVPGEILPAYVDRVRHDQLDVDGNPKLDITLRVPGGKGKADSLANIILETLKKSEDGMVDVGDKSSPGEINKVFPGQSKASFKRAVASLYKKGLVQPGRFETRLM